jgi:type VI secretion system secreted protein VgrG
MLIGDANAGFIPSPDHEVLPFHPIGGAVDSGDSVVAIRRVIQTVPRLAFVRDYNDELPANVVMNDRKASIDEVGWPGDRYGHGFHVSEDEHVADSSQANRIAGLRAEEQLVRKNQFVGRTTLRSLRSGQTFTLEGHGTAAFEKKYVVTELEHFCDQEAQAEAPGDGEAPAEAPTTQSYTNEFVAIPDAVAYRPARLTPRPKIHGAIFARIDGESATTAAPIDEHGRYRVLLPFDTVAALGGKATHPIRMAQPYSGPGYGMHMPLHQGAEVLLVHIDGDPDRPVIAATVPNRSMTTPLVAQYATRGVIQTRSAVRIEFDDDA